jgi:hypothetical protein
VLKVTAIKRSIDHYEYTKPTGGLQEMVHLSIIEARLSKLDFKVSRWFKPEIRELQHILWEDEEIIECVQGRYFGGFALLVATEHRLLLIDKKLPYLSVEDVRYDMISAINYSTQMFDANINMSTINKQHQFRSWKHKEKLKRLVTYAQQRIMQLRQYQQQAAQEVLPAASPSVPSLIQAYNYGQALQLQPPNITSSIRKRLPSPHLPRIVGAAAISGARRWVNPNIYTSGSYVMHNQYSQSS